MKYARFITTISLVFFTACVWACSPDIYYPTGYYLFHLVDLPDDASGGFNLNSEENCRLWQQQTSMEIPLDDIYQLVYKYDIETLAALKAHDIPLPARENKMAQWLVSHDDQEAIDFLILAKNCEWLRLERRSPWYYPSKNDPVRFSLNDVADVAMQKTHGRFADRYALQAVRAMTSLRQYDEIIRFWEDCEKGVSAGMLRQMALSYVAGAYFHLGDIEQAKQHYILANDLYGLLECDQRYHGNLSRVERMELLYENYPDCPDFRVQLWEIFGQIEPDHNTHSDDWHWDVGVEKEEIYQLAKLCDKVLNGDKPADKALWAYSATFIAHLQGDDKKADGYLRTAEKVVKDQNLSDAIKVMRMYIDAQICTYDKAYEQKLFGQLRWLQVMLESHIDDETIAGTNDFYGLKTCRSYYYWSDAMRCILLGTVCPKMMKAGKTTHALQLANMSSYSLLNALDSVGITSWDDDFINEYGGMHITLTMEQFRHGNFFNDYDYSCHFAQMMDTLSANELMDYARIAERPQTEFQRFLNRHSYIDLDYLNEIIGTHCLREMRYAEAERYFAKVSTDYFLRTNVYKCDYLNRDPFSTKHRLWGHGVDAKLYFAKTMNRLEQDIAATADPNRKAMLMIDYGVGLRNSFDYCWALTHYRYGCLWDIIDDYDWQEDEPCLNAMKRVETLFAEALSLFTNDEYAAQAQLMFCNYKTVREQYPKTQAGDIVRGRCDKYADYHAEGKRFAYLGER